MGFTKVNRITPVSSGRRAARLQLRWGVVGAGIELPAQHSIEEASLTGCTCTAWGPSAPMYSPHSSFRRKCGSWVIFTVLFTFMQEVLGSGATPIKGARLRSIS